MGGAVVIDQELSGELTGFMPEQKAVRAGERTKAHAQMSSSGSLSLPDEGS
jgi:hypothetical protein